LLLLFRDVIGNYYFSSLFMFLFYSSFYIQSKYLIFCSVINEYHVIIWIFHFVLYHSSVYYSVNNFCFFILIFDACKTFYSKKCKILCFFIPLFIFRLNTYLIFCSINHVLLFPDFITLYYKLLSCSNQWMFLCGSSFYIH